MKHNIKKLVSLLVVMSILLSSSILAVNSAAEENIYTFEYDGNTIEINADGLTYDQAQQIADRIFYGETDTSTYGILCIFGHSLDTTIAAQIQHKYYDASPRCVRKTYQVEYCTRSSCTYSNATLINSLRVSCCAED